MLGAVLANPGVFLLSGEGLVGRARDLGSDLAVTAVGGGDPQYLQWMMQQWLVDMYLRRPHQHLAYGQRLDCPLAAPECGGRYEDGGDHPCVERYNDILRTGVATAPAAPGADPASYMYDMMHPDPPVEGCPEGAPLAAYLDSSSGDRIVVGVLLLAAVFMMVVGLVGLSLMLITTELLLRGHHRFFAINLLLAAITSVLFLGLQRRLLRAAAAGAPGLGKAATLGYSPFERWQRHRAARQTVHRANRYQHRWQQRNSPVPGPAQPATGGRRPRPRWKRAVEGTVAGPLVIIQGIRGGAGTRSEAAGWRRWVVRQWHRTHRAGQRALRRTDELLVRADSWLAQAEQRGPAGTAAGRAVSATPPAAPWTPAGPGSETPS